VVTIGAGGPVVACGDGWLELTKLQPEGGRAMDGTAYLHGHGLEPGEVLGRAERGE
jgi:methionyl-tRNA formyltransferase